MSTSEAIKRSVDSLERIYAVIVALAIGQAIQQTFIDSDTGSISFNLTLLQYLPIFLTFIVTIVPFYQGMNRHLDTCYIERTDHHVQGALLVDFFVFFVEASMLFAFATTIKTDLQSFVFLGLLLLIDTVWAFISHLIHYRDIAQSVKQWSVINAVALLLGILIYFLDLYSSEVIAWILFLIALARSIVDYYLTWDLYFPSEESS